MTEERKKLVEFKGVDLVFNKGKKNVNKAINDVSFHIYEGETFGLVGESGSGKTTIGRAIMKLYDINKGEIHFNGNDVSKIKGAELKKFREKVQMIFQDPQASLNGRMRVKDIIAEGIDVNGLAKNNEDRTEKVKELLKLVGLNQDHMTRYPHEFSGGQRQRIGIARALAVNPKFIVADEPISALDVSIQAQVVNLMRDIQEKEGLTYLFIAHDLSMVKYISDRIGVMHWGKILEIGTSDQVYNNALHPYTQSLLSAIPAPDPISERSRIPQAYDPTTELDGQPRELREITPGHFVLSTEEEAEKYRKIAMA
ncbi:ABC transporter ATP-binding protein [Lactococcus formosensis]|jgi:ATPase components of various ABC-type transport systems, contain duplicated ATPase|uniref:ATP-binding cassette domain-containing protein n=1 Tax=Lactococcus formosensis TaxID=1281486 RepID=A0A9Q9D733_9LACT|nr:ATP-binding cassette domain-containing protein [Lactococcus formosensis]NHI66628.1 ABC transporter ATP-binding protein [Lactococcus garvieae]MCH1722777.1 ATP-binding cassette domain-containing protein [Lactococcus formosensis]MCO7179795.1 ATP-binding cassette domain-containing protein [Lactococcus formosensis]MDG6110886.1 ATP-binding cassette domain-containing protein [Lactococcus formosensis]MDG6113072.1 ATP-binding cassette domain-containing protein [Lactococcus formosensis]